MLTLNGRPTRNAKAMQATSSAYLVILPVGRMPTAPNNKIKTAGMQTLEILIALLLNAVSVTAALAASLDKPTLFSSF